MMKSTVFFATIIIVLATTISVFSSPAAAAATTIGQNENKKYKVLMERLTSAPVLTEKFSNAQYNYNSAYLPFIGGSYQGVAYDCLAIRAQNVTTGGVEHHSKKIFRNLKVGFVTPSIITIQCETGHAYPFQPSSSRVILDVTQDAWQHLGAEDPRVAYVPSLHSLLMFYTSVNNITNQYNPTGDVRAMLSLATCNLTESPTCQVWKRRGPIFPKIRWSKSGALLVRDTPPHYLFWGDSSICIATTHNFIDYETDGKNCLIHPRPDFFDSELVESGPPPMQLTDKNFIFIHNSAKKYTDPNPSGFKLQYNVGYVILDHQSPSTHILQRSDTPLFSPLLPWETCDDKSGIIGGLTPNVVFIEGVKPMKADNTWLVYYQGCDSWTGLALLTVQVPPSSPLAPKNPSEEKKWVAVTICLVVLEIGTLCGAFWIWKKKQMGNGNYEPAN